MDLFDRYDILTVLVCLHGRWLLRVAIHLREGQGVGTSQRSTSYPTCFCVSETLQPPLTIDLTRLSWSAIVRGAAAKGLEGDGRAPIKNRKCRRNYGTDFYTIFTPGKHKEIDSFVSPYTGIKQARNQMEWMLKKGQDLAAKSESHGNVGFRQYFWPGDRREASLDLLAADVDKAPYRSQDKVHYDAFECIQTLSY
jgi:hypothetical protein